jgi:hypothetical protein
MRLYIQKRNGSTEIIDSFDSIEIIGDTIKVKRSVIGDFVGDLKKDVVRIELLTRLLNL